MDEWYKEWFNTEEYLSVYRHRNDEDARLLAELILSNLKIPAGANVLDMACGPGRHSILFAEKGFKVTAVDLSEKLLSVAKKSAEEAGVKVNFVHSDLRCFSEAAKFNLVLNLFTSFGYFEDDEENFKIFEVAFDHLMSGGYFVLDFLNKNYIEKNLIPESVDKLVEGKIIQQRYIKDKRVIKKISIIRDGSEKYFHESVRMYCKHELIASLENKGFLIKKVFGDFEGNSFSKATSPRIIIIAQK